MAVYSDIIAWSNNKAPFIRDAVRRILHSTLLTEQDTLEIKELLKKEHGFEGITLEPSFATEADVPTSTDTTNQIKLKQISSPHNISALFASTALSFSTDKLNIVYGKNGSGKTSFSKILKKLCWSRDNAVTLKKNVYSRNTEEQSVTIKYIEGGTEKNFIWREGQSTDEKLNSIYIFDTKCAGIYLNQENPAEYKPAGIDVLERLLQLFGKLSEIFDNDISQLNLNKVELDGSIYNNTEIYRWYQNLENYRREDICDKLSISAEQLNHKQALEKSLKDSNPSATNQGLKHKLNRYNSLYTILENINKLFNTDVFRNITDLLRDLQIKEEANRLARKSYEEGLEFSIESPAWKTLWEAARNYATEELHTSHPIAVNEHGEYCVLCQQPLSDDAKTRLKRFESYIQDTTSTALNLSQTRVQQVRSTFEDISTTFLTDEIKRELIEDNPDFADVISKYIEQVTNAQKFVLEYIDRKQSDLKSGLINAELLQLIKNEIEKLNRYIKTNDVIIENRTKIEKEFLELDALYYLVQKREVILAYHDKCILKKKYQECLNALNTRSISTKIGELLDSNAIAAQHKLFLQYLNKMNPQIAAKMELRKTRTNSGVTYQRCGFNSISENITEILSEGEQKIVSIANFLAECTIDNAINSIIFDDPVNSLDMDYRESIANMIVHLSRNRQIVVLTHDLYFLRLLKDTYKKVFSDECYVTCINSVGEHCGVVSDEIPYLAKNIQERINTIMAGLDEIKRLDISQIDKRNSIINDLKDKMRQLLERTVEDVLVNKAISRFSKNISFKKCDLANMILIEKDDIDFLLSLYGKYSEVIHDGSVETVSNTLTERDIHTDITDYKNWKDNFIHKAREWKKNNGYE